MKDVLVGNKRAGFSTLELMIAFTLMALALASAITANVAAQYWSVTAQTGNEGLYKAKSALEDARALIKQDFFQVASSPLTRSADATDPADSSCIAGGMCYFVERIVEDFSSCSKYLTANVEWKVDGYASSSVSLFTHLTSSAEAINRGGDCLLNQPAGDWQHNSPQQVGRVDFNPGKLITSLDALHGRVYLAASTSPAFSVYAEPTGVGVNPTLFYSTDISVAGKIRRLNAVDVEEDLSTGRTYAFVAVDATTSQLAVIDVNTITPASSALVATRNLRTTDAFGSYPQGWKVFIYGGRLYLTTRETQGPELHIFDISTPTLPTEIGNGVELNRTVNDMVVREQRVGGTLKRLLYLASDSDLKEIGIFDVTNDTVSELSATDLPGSQDALSLTLVGNTLYLGRAQNSAGPELYALSIADPSLSLPILGSGEVGADVTGIEVSGAYAYLTTSKSGEEFQVWNSSANTWGGFNVGRYKTYSFAHLSPSAFDIEDNWIYLGSLWSAQDSLTTLYAQN